MYQSSQYKTPLRLTSIRSTLSPFIFLLFLGANSSSANTYAVTNTSNSGLGSLRQAIIEANSNSGPDNIVFNISGSAPHTISVLSSLPTITDTLVIDGSTQPANGYAGDAPKIELDGTSFNGGSGFSLSQVSECEIYGIYIHGFSTGIYGLFVYDMIIGSNTKKNVISGNSGSGINMSGVNNMIIHGNYIGTDTSGTMALGNNYGIYFQSGVDNTTIIDNVISGNTEDGIYILTGSGMVIKGNKIGTDYTGNVNLGNGGSGVEMWPIDSATIGGTYAGEGNVISGNNDYGLWIFSPNTTVIGNKIGTNISGTNPIPNNIGIFVADMNIIVGGSTTFESNLISGNNIGIKAEQPTTIMGNRIGTDVTGTTALPNTMGIELWAFANNTVIQSNLISGNGKGINIKSNLDSVVIKKNSIGTDASGTFAVPNAWGIYSTMGQTIIVGGDNSNDANLISGNTVVGVRLDCNNAVIINNKIGVDINDNLYIPNGTGVSVFGAGIVNFNKIGGNINTGVNVFFDSLEAKNNIIIDNGGRGIYSQATLKASNNAISGNGGEGIRIESGPSSSLINNTISNNGGRGIHIEWSDLLVIDSNIITWNSHDGIFILNGNYASLSYNTVSDNDSIGIHACLSNYSSTSDNVIKNNLSHGLKIWPGKNWMISNDTIAQNGEHGIYILDSTSTQNRISLNSIYDNLMKGIELAYGTVDEANIGYPPPVINIATPDSVLGTSAPFGAIELYYNGSANNNPQGKTYFGTTSADSSGDWRYIGLVTDPCNVTALAIDSANNSSEFADIPSPVWNLELGPDTVLLCADSLVLDAGVNSLSFLWSTGDTTKTINADSSGYYYVTLLDSNGCSILTDSINIIIPSSLSLITSSTNAKCTGICDGFASVIALGGTSPYSFIWSDTLSQTTQVAIGLSTGNYMVTVYDSNGCMVSDTAYISEPPLIQGSIVTTICSGDSAFAQGTYQNTAGTYYDTLVTTNGCDSVHSTTITIYSEPVISFSGLDSIYCATDAGVNLIGSPGGGAFTGTGGLAGNQFFPATGVGIYTIYYTYTDSNNCTSSDSQNVSINICLGIDDEELSNRISVYPNPFSLETTVHMSENLRLSQGKLEVYDLTGKVVHTYPVLAHQTQLTIKAEDVGTGFYFLRLIDAKGIRASSKVIILD